MPDLTNDQLLDIIFDLEEAAVKLEEVLATVKDAVSTLEDAHAETYLVPAIADALDSRYNRYNMGLQGYIETLRSRLNGSPE